MKRALHFSKELWVFRYSLFNNNLLSINQNHSPDPNKKISKKDFQSRVQGGGGGHPSNSAELESPGWLVGPPLPPLPPPPPEYHGTLGEIPERYQAFCQAKSLQNAKKYLQNAKKSAQNAVKRPENWLLSSKMGYQEMLRKSLKSLKSY